MIVWICTDMEGLAGIDHWDQCYHPDDHAPEYLYGRDQLTEDANAAIEGCFDAGVTEVRILDGHGRNRNKGFTEALDERATKVWIASRNPLRWEGLDDSVQAVVMIGQHAMAGTINGFLDHTQSPKDLCCFRINGEEAGEMSQMALYAGGFGVSLVYVSGDEALCSEAARIFPKVSSTPTKQGTGWATCDLYPRNEVRSNIRRDIKKALLSSDWNTPWKLTLPIEVSVEFAWSGKVDGFARIPGVQRNHARAVSWKIDDLRNIFDWPNPGWHPLA